MTDERIEKLTKCAEAASILCNAVPQVADEFDADVGMTALILCGFLAGKIVGNEEGLITKDEFFEQMQTALAVREGDMHPTEQ